MQLSLTGFKRRKTHGGSVRKGKRKLSRPWDPKRAHHVVLRASDRAPTTLSERGRKIVNEELIRARMRFSVRVIEFANCGDHIHLLLRSKNQSTDDLKNFLRLFAGRVAQRITGARKGKPFGRFWALLAWSRVVEWGRALKVAAAYVRLNFMEAHGLERRRDWKIRV